MAQKRNTSKNAKAEKSREDRLKAALKANLARRKSQSRVRAQENKAPDKPGQDKDV